MIYLFQTKEGLIGKAQKGKDKFWEIQINGKPYQWFDGTVATMKRMVRKDYPNATFRKVAARGKQ